MRRAWGAILSLAAALCAQDAPPAGPARDASSAQYEQALRLLRKERWADAQMVLRRLLRVHPESIHRADAMVRSEDNCYLGTETLWRGGPSSRRIDVAIMGDGFTVDAAAQRTQRKWADDVLEVLWNEKSFSRYRGYFNIHFVRLASLEEGVDPQWTAEQLRKIHDKNRRRSKSRQTRTDYSTALDAKAMGPQGQVMMSRALVYKWLGTAERDLPGVGDDRYVIAFAQFGKLGMGGGGIANVGRPDKSVTTHEFGHAFARLLDEYAIQPGPPQPMFARALQAANVHVSDDEPRADEVPWAHFLERHDKQVGIFEGGGTYTKGVWRPARSCAMNAAGDPAYCPVCREQTILVIYEHVSPIDEALPAPAAEIVITEGESRSLTIVPMEPYKARLDVKWYVADRVVTRREPVDSGPGIGDFEAAAPAEPEASAPPAAPLPFGGHRARQDRSTYAHAPSGKEVSWARFHRPRGRAGKRTPPRSVFPLAKLGVGTWRVTCEVEDPTPWVLRDEKHLLRERVTWTVTVQAQPEAAAR